MEFAGGSLILGCLASLAVGGWAWEHEHRRRAVKSASLLADAHGATIRLLRLTSEDQRNLALTLFGHAQRLQPPDGALNGLARRLLDLSEDLARQTEVPDAARTLSEEDLFLMPVMDFAVSQVTAHLGPSRRVWRIDPLFVRTCLLADRRAVNQVLVNVLSGAAAATRDGDLIEITGEAGPDEFAIVIQDEGIGLPVATCDGFPRESRGIGVRLTLARSLMLAHGGTLTVDSTEHVGTRVRLGFPARRLLDGPNGATSEPARPAIAAARL